MSRSKSRTKAIALHVTEKFAMDKLAADEPSPERRNNERRSAEKRKKERRATGRLAHEDVKAVIQFKTGPGNSHKEIAKLSSLSKSGCSFDISHPSAVGRLVTMVVPMPDEFRAYDLEEDLYPVIGLVQNCYAISTNEGSMYRVGVAFVGRDFPPSYEVDPMQNYHISGTSPNGMWKITESGKKFHIRNAPRFWIETDVTLTWVRKEHRTSDKEDTVTVNVSTTGASVVSKLMVKVGDRVKFAHKQLNFYTIAIVRNRRDRQGLPPIIHLEFVDRKLPVERLPVPQVTDVTDVADQDRFQESATGGTTQLASA